jgi:uncharacterized protein (TIGR02996 family)
MNDDAFLGHILDDPADEARRLVYADYLEERGDPRADWLRLDVRLATGELAGKENVGRWVSLAPHRPDGVPSLALMRVSAALATVGPVLAQVIHTLAATLAPILAVARQALAKQPTLLAPALPADRLAAGGGPPGRDELGGGVPPGGGLVG